MLTKDELDALVQDIRQQSSTWLGDEACEKIERLIAHTMFLRGHHDNVQQMLVNGYRMIQVGSDPRKS
jgi:hypothetical protein